MYLSDSEAVAFVRARIDEISSSLGTDMMNAVDVDDRNLEKIVEDQLPYAIDYIHNNASASLLDGITDYISKYFTIQHAGANQDIVSLINNGNLKILRLVWLRIASDPVVITSVKESSISGRLQNNRFLRGTSKDPVLVELHESKEGMPNYKYYSHDKEDMKIADSKISYLPYAEKEESGIHQGKYYISIKLRTPILDYLTGMVLTTYNEVDKAKLFTEKAMAAIQ